MNRRNFVKFGVGAVAGLSAVSLLGWKDKPEKPDNATGGVEWNLKSVDIEWDKKESSWGVAVLTEIKREPKVGWLWCHRLQVKRGKPNLKYIVEKFDRFWKRNFSRNLKYDKRMFYDAWENRRENENCKV